MTPALGGIDHVHVYVSNWARAEEWYARILGFRRVESLMSWAVDGGPLTIEDPKGSIHLALFEREQNTGGSAIAFSASGEQFIEWQRHMERHGISLRLTDHQLAYSMYFHDPDENLHEITTYDRDYVAERLSK